MKNESHIYICIYIYIYIYIYKYIYIKYYKYTKYSMCICKIMYICNKRHLDDFVYEVMFFDTYVKVCIF